MGAGWSWLVSCGVQCAVCMQSQCQYATVQAVGFHTPQLKADAGPY
jgi:hypothetical protein